MRKTLAILLIVLLCSGALLVSCMPALPYALDPGSAGWMAEGTAQAAQRAANQLYAVATQQAEAAALAATLTAAYQATEQAWTQQQWTATAAVAQSTQIAAATGTQQALVVSQTQEAGRITATAAAISAQGTAIVATHVAVTLRQDEARQELINSLAAALPYALLILATLATLTAGGVLLVKYWRRPQVITRDARGDAPLLVDNHGTIYDADRNPSPVIRVLPSGPVIPVLAPAELQERTTARDQAIDAASRGLPGAQMLNGRNPKAPTPPAVETGNGQARIMIYRPDETPTQLLQDPDAMQVLDAEWKEENLHGSKTV